MASNIIQLSSSRGKAASAPQSTPPAPATNKFKFTVKRLQALPAPDKSAKYYYDTEQAGLSLRVTAKGAKTYVLARRINGKYERITLDKFAAINLQAARDAAGQLNGKIAASVDVIAEKKAARVKGLTVGESFKSWLKAAKSRKLRTWAGDEKLWELHLKKKLNTAELSKLTSLDIQRLADRIGEKHPRTANKCVALLSRIYTHATKRGEYSTINPCKVVDRFTENSRERFLMPEEMPTFIDAVMGEDEPWRGYFLTLLYTGARRGAVLGMRWQDIDLTGGVWHLPSWASKNKKALAIALTPPAVKLLQALKLDKINDFVFPSITSKSGHLETPTKPWKRICERGGFDDLRIHDMRRTVGSWLAANGANGFVISKALGHLSSRSAEVYARLSVDPVRDALNGIQETWASSATNE